MTQSQKAIFNKTALIAIDAIKQARKDLNDQGKFTLASELLQTLSDIRALCRDLVPNAEDE